MLCEGCHVISPLWNVHEQENLWGRTYLDESSSLLLAVADLGDVCGQSIAVVGGHLWWWWKVCINFFWCMYIYKHICCLVSEPTDFGMLRSVQGMWSGHAPSSQVALGSGEETEIKAEEDDSVLDVHSAAQGNCYKDFLESFVYEKDGGTLEGSLVE